jgi:hypothetical protein
MDPDPRYASNAALAVQPNATLIDWDRSLRSDRVPPGPVTMTV